MDTNKRLTRDVDPLEKETEEEIQKKSRLRSPSSSITDEDMQPCQDMQPCVDLQPRDVSMYSEFVEELQLSLPSCWLLWSKDWTYLLKKIGPSSSIYPSVRSDLASFCHWFLSTAPELYKDGANQVVKLIITSETSLATGMSTDHQEGANQALKFIITSGTSLATEMSTDHQSESYLLERVLDSKCSLLILQACQAIGFLCWFHGDNYFKDLSFSDGVVNRLFNLVEQDSQLRDHARRAICSIACVDKRVKDKIITKTKRDTKFKWPFLFGDAEEVEHACMIVACIVWGLQKDDATWDQIEGCLIPPIVDVMKMARIVGDIPVMVAAAYAISSAPVGSTDEQIKKLHYMGCFEVLCNTIGWSPPLTSHVLDGMQFFLASGYEEDKVNFYADWIEYDEDSPGWEALLLVKDEFLSSPCTMWEARDSIEYRALLTAFMFGGRPWLYQRHWYYDSDNDMES